MRQRLLVLVGFAAVAAVVSMMLTTVAGQTPARTGSSTLKTAWGEPDLQGIWTDDYQTPLQRAEKYGNKEFFTPQEQQELDRQRAALLRREARVERGTEKDVAG